MFCYFQKILYRNILILNKSYFTVLIHELYEPKKLFSSEEHKCSIYKIWLLVKEHQ